MARESYFGRGDLSGMEPEVHSNKDRAAADPSAGDEFSRFALEDREDKKRLRIALMAAFLIHAILLAVNFPTLAGDITVETKKPKVFVLQHLRFKPPPTTPEDRIPKLNRFCSPTCSLGTRRSPASLESRGWSSCRRSSTEKEELPKSRF